MSGMRAAQVAKQAPLSTNRAATARRARVGSIGGSSLEGRTERREMVIFSVRRHMDYATRAVNYARRAASYAGAAAGYARPGSRLRRRHTHYANRQTIYAKRFGRYAGRFVDYARRKADYARPAIDYARAAEPARAVVSRVGGKRGWIGIE